MDLLIYTHRFYPSLGGIEKFVADHASELARRGWSVCVLTDTPLGEGDDDSTRPYTVHRCVGWSDRLALFSKAACIHVAGPAFVPLLLGVLLQKRVIVRHHGYQACCPLGDLWYRPEAVLCPGSFARREYRRCIRCINRGLIGGVRALMTTWARQLLLRLVTANVCNSHHTFQRLALPHSRVLYNGISVGSSPGCNSNRADGSVEIAYVGGLDRIKGVHVLLSAIGHLRDCGVHARAKVVGEGVYRPELERLVERLAIADRVSFMGALPPWRRDAVVAPFDILVMPSICEETFGFSALEHMARGGPTVASRIGGLAEVVGPSGLGMEAGDAVALAGVIRVLLEDPERRHAAAAAGRRRASEMFDIANITPAWERLYRGEPATGRDQHE